MNNQDVAFDKIYPALKTDLNALKGKLFFVRIAAFLTRLIEVYFITVVISLFLGFMQMFPFEDFPANSIFSLLFQGFMYGVLGLVVFIIVLKQVKIQVGEKNIALSKNGFLIYGIALLCTAIIISIARYIGTHYLGSDLNLTFFAKWAGGIFSVLLLMIPHRWMKASENKFREKYRKICFHHFLINQEPSLVFESEKYVHREVFAASKLFTYQEIFSYEGSLHFKIASENVEGSFLEVKQIEKHVSNGKSETKITELFKGFLFVMDSSKQFEGETYIIPDPARMLLGEVYGEYINSLLHQKKTKLVATENTKFEADFSVYATDATEARYLLSPKVLEQIAALKNTFYQDLFFSFVKNKIYIAIKTEKELFAPKLFGNIADEKVLRQQFVELGQMLSIQNGM